VWSYKYQLTNRFCQIHLVVADSDPTDQYDIRNIASIVFDEFVSQLLFVEEDDMIIAIPVAKKQVK